MRGWGIEASPVWRIESIAGLPVHKFANDIRYSFRGFTKINKRVGHFMCSTFTVEGAVEAAAESLKRIDWTTRGHTKNELENGVRLECVISSSSETERECHVNFYLRQRYGASAEVTRSRTFWKSLGWDDDYDYDDEGPSP